MKLINSLKDWCERLDEMLADGEEHLALIVHLETEIAYGWNEDVNLDYCLEHGIPAFNQKRNGGCIVCSQGNVGIGFIYNNHVYKEWVCVHLLRDFAEWLTERGLDVRYEKNDVLIDGCKVASGCGYNIPPDFIRSYEGVQISVNQDLETIKSVCKKKMEKIPKALSEYGITTEEVYRWVSGWFSDYLAIAR